MSEYPYPDLDGLTEEAQAVIKRLFREMIERMKERPERKKIPDGVIALDWGYGGPHNEIAKEYLPKIMEIKRLGKC